MIIVMINDKKFWIFSLQFNKDKKISMACGQIMFIIINVFISWLQDRMTSDDNDSIVQWSGLHNCSPSQQVGGPWVRPDSWL